jgi:hypothetical protein
MIADVNHGEHEAHGDIAFKDQCCFFRKVFSVCAVASVVNVRD